MSSRTVKKYGCSAHGCGNDATVTNQKDKPDRVRGGVTDERKGEREMRNALRQQFIPRGSLFNGYDE